VLAFDDVIDSRVIFIKLKVSVLFCHLTPKRPPSHRGSSHDNTTEGCYLAQPQQKYTVNAGFQK